MMGVYMCRSTSLFMIERVIHAHEYLLVLREEEEERKCALSAGRADQDKPGQSITLGAWPIAVVHLGVDRYARRSNCSAC
jgi:hypothetical protein